MKFNIKENPKTFAYVLENDTGFIRCNSCGSVVLKETNKTKDNYPYQCMSCDVNMFEVETNKGNFHTSEELEELCCNTRDLLLLDN